MKINSKVFLLLTLTLLAGGAFSQQMTISLQEAVTLAMENNMEVANAITREQTAIAQKNEVRGIGLPQLNASVEVNNYLQRPTSLIPGEIFGKPGTYEEVQFGTKYNATAGVSLSQLIFSGDYIVALQSSQAFVGLSTQSIHKTKVDIAEQITKSYYGILINEERVQIISENLDRLDKTKQETQKMYESGFVEKIDLDRISVAYNNLSIQKVNLEKMLNIGYAYLKFQMGTDMQQEITLSDSLDAELVENIPTESPFSYEDRIDYNLLQSQKTLSELNIKRYRYGYLPNLYLQGNLSTQAQRNEFNFFDFNEKWFPIALIGVGMNVNLFDGFQRKYKIEQTRYDLLINERTITNMEKGIDLEIQQSLTKLESSISTLNMQKSNVQLALDILETTGKKYKAGTATSMELTEAEGALTESQSNYYNALYEAIIAKVEYEKATGKLFYPNEN